MKIRVKQAFIYTWAIATAFAASSPTFAATITGASITGTGAPQFGVNPATDFQVFVPDGTFACPIPDGTLGCLVSEGADATLLVSALTDGSSTAPEPGGNIELFSSSEIGFPTTSFNNFLAYEGVTNLNVDFDDGTTTTFSSLTAKDLFGDTLNVAFGADNLANTWFDMAFDANLTKNGITETQLFDALSNNGFGLLASREAIYTAFRLGGGFQRTVDPNIAYVTKDGENLSYGLAGSTDLFLFAGLVPGLSEALTNEFGDLDLQVSELVKVNGEVNFFFNPVPSNVASADGSFNGTFPGGGSASIPEPATGLLGLMAIVSVFGFSRRMGT
ncbi:NF038130 family PEP-CTERM protein [Oscillatoriales cyanobacterium LEGE 11467]|uniref:NF038130 family PEP-CTERM protein n=1 Tax=Zarconia navalis LEGE 11467 TaxID=1828826 RepID=A0A928Z9R0_9CYAN|nr:NF038130 family PEP-CTERM protein [Zarconia navalis]MBE9041979.1 NF038130 family PEP-CTERM protein [Zarconia navalis LEGE 11467]